MLTLPLFFVDPSPHKTQKWEDKTLVVEGTAPSFPLSWRREEREWRSLLLTSSPPSCFFFFSAETQLKEINEDLPLLSSPPFLPLFPIPSTRKKRKEKV